MNHGAGGRAAAQLIEELFARAFENPALREGNDGAVLPAPPPGPHRLVDGHRHAHVISPLFFPGGDIGALSVHGTVNDVAMMGAQPLYLAASFILEEGYPLADLKRLVDSMAAAAREAGVAIVTGDTKVVEQGKGDGVFISTTGVGWLPPGRRIAGDQARPGDVVLLSGTIGEHGVAVLSLRESLEFETAITSDTAALNGLTAAMLAAVPEGSVRVLRDPTRGGLATTLNEITRQSGIGITLDEAAIPVLPQVEAACELLGLDPLYVANEGKLVAICAPEVADTLLTTMREHPNGHAAARIGVVTEDPHRFVQMTTRFGGGGSVDWLEWGAVAADLLTALSGRRR